MANILIADDSASMRQMVAFTLKSKGHAVTEANDGQEALSAAKTKVFDLVLSDVNMPNMDGIAFVKALRGEAGYTSVPVLMLTTESAADMKQKGKAAGATGWIVKPFNPDQLLAVVGKLLN